MLNEYEPLLSGSLKLYNLFYLTRFEKGLHPPLRGMLIRSPFCRGELFKNNSFPVPPQGVDFFTKLLGS